MDLGFVRMRRAFGALTGVRNPRRAPLPSMRRLVSDDLWELIEPLIPACPAANNGRTGRPRLGDRPLLQRIVVELTNGIGRTKLPTELGLGSGVTPADADCASERSPQSWRRLASCHPRS